MGSKKKAFIIGYPIGHSLSPKLHGFWLRQYGIDGEYEAINVPPEYLVKTIKKLPEKDYVGGNVTIPHKEKVMMLCDEIDEFAKEIGAVNTLVFRNGKIIGSNTDWIGFIENLRDNDVHINEFANKKALVLGAGGAARPIVKVLRHNGFDVDIANRNLERAESLAQTFQAKAIYWNDRNNLGKYSLIVNTTSLGMKGEPELEIDLSLANKDAVVTDIVYNPLETNLLKQAREKGLKTVDGLGMLLWQAAPGFELWFGKKPEVTEELREYVIKAMQPKLPGHD